jgi:ribosome-binding factor A
MLRIHTVPSLHFVFDSSLEKAIELSSLIDQANATPPVED